MATYSLNRPFRSLPQHIEDAETAISAARYMRRMIDKDLNSDPEHDLLCMMFSLEAAIASLQAAQNEAHRIAYAIKGNSTRWSYADQEFRDVD